MFAFILLPIFFASSMAQVPMARPCNLTGIENLNFTQYAGRWHEHFRYPMVYTPSTCDTEDFVEYPDGTGILTARWLPLNATSSNDTVLSRVAVQIDGSIAALTSLEGPSYRMNCTFLSTDYVSYSIKGYCVDAGLYSLFNYWIYGRTSEPFTEAVLEKVYQALEDLEIPMKYFKVMDQSHCPNWKFGDGST